MGLFTGVDLHSNNGYYGIINENEERIFKKKLPNHLPTVLSNLEPFREDIVGIVVESTYNLSCSPRGAGHGPKVEV